MSKKFFSDKSTSRKSANVFLSRSEKQVSAWLPGVCPISQQFERTLYLSRSSYGLGRHIRHEPSLRLNRLAGHQDEGLMCRCGFCLFFDSCSSLFPRRLRCVLESSAFKCPSESFSSKDSKYGLCWKHSVVQMLSVLLFEGCQQGDPIWCQHRDCFSVSPCDRVVVDLCVGMDFGHPSKL